MDHELLHNDRGDFDLRLSNKVKREKDKTDAGLIFKSLQSLLVLGISKCQFTIL